MWYTYIFNTVLDEEPYYSYGDISYRNVYNDNCIKVKMDFEDNIDFEAGVIGYGFNTDNIKDYESLLKFLEDHYSEVEEDDDSIGIFTRRECIDELIAICKEKCIK